MKTRCTYADSAPPLPNHPLQGAPTRPMWISPILAAFVVSLTLASFTGCTLSTRNSKLKAIKKALTGETPTSLSDPTSLIVTSKSTSQISLAWADVSLDETSYEIERCGGLACTDFVPVSGLSPLAADASAASDTSIAPSTYYSFRVRAVSTKGSSAWLVKADIAPAATRLVFSTSPSASNTASFNFATQPVINASDSASDTDTDYTTTISLAAYTDAGCLTAATGTLSSGTLSPTGGVSTFTGINYTQSGSFYFKATSGTLTAACSPAFSVAPGSVSLLAFTVSPSSTNTAGSNFATQPKVAARDAANNLANSYTGGVTISPYTDVGCLTSATGTLSGAVISASGGIATFTALNYSDLAGTYYLKAVSGAASSACTSAFTLANGAATQLVYGAQPGPSATVSTNVVTNPTVTAKDAGGNPLSGYSTVMTLSAYTDVGCLTAATGTLTGRTATPSSGIATYATLKYNTSGNIYLRATSGSLTAACSSLLTVSNAATKLAFVTAPSATNTAAIDFATQPIVAAQDSGSVTVPTYSSDVTLAIYTNVACTTAAGGGVLNGAPATASGGLATFSGVNYSAAGTYYLRASSGALTTACSSAFTIAIGAASKLAFLTMPTAYVGSPIFPYISVQAQDAGGNLVTSYTSSVTVAIATNPSATELV